MTGEVKVLAFDVFGTTVDWCSGVAREAEAMLSAKGHRLNWENFARDWRREYQPAMESVRDGARPFAVLDVLHAEMLAKVLKSYGILLSADERRELSYAWRKLDPWPDVVAGMERLRKKYVLAAVSNGNIALISAMAKRAGLPWDLILGAELVKQYKPRAEVYDSVAQMMMITNAEVMMVACHPWDLDGAKARGLKTGYVRRAREYGAPASAPPPRAGTYDLQVEDFGELASALGA